MVNLGYKSRSIVFLESNDVGGDPNGGDGGVCGDGGDDGACGGDCINGG